MCDQCATLMLPLRYLTSLYVIFGGTLSDFMLTWDGTLGIIRRWFGGVRYPPMNPKQRFTLGCGRMSQ